MDDKNQALKFALKLLGIRKRSVFEMKERLRQKEFENNTIAEVIEELLEYKYLNSDELHKISNQFKEIDGYLYSNAAIINPSEICKYLIKDCDFYQKDIKELKLKDGYYHFEDLI